MLVSEKEIQKEIQKEMQIRIGIEKEKMMKEKLNVSKSFRFTTSLVEQINELKAFLGNKDMSDNLAMTMIVQNYYNDVYVQEVKQYFYGKVEEVLKLMELYQDVNTVDIYRKAFNIVMEELEVTRISSKQTHKDIFIDFIDFIMGNMSVLGEEAIVQTIDKAKVLKLISDNISRRLVHDLNLQGSDIDNVQKAIETIKMYHFYEYDVLVPIFKEDYLNGELAFLEKKVSISDEKNN